MNVFVLQNLLSQQFLPGTDLFFECIRPQTLAGIDTDVLTDDTLDMFGHLGYTAAA